MRLLCVIDNLGTGGAQRQLVTLATGLQKRGHTIEFFCYTQGDLLGRPLLLAGIPVHRGVKRSRFDPGVIAALRKLMLAQGYDLVISFLTTPNLYAIAAGSSLGSKRAVTVVSERFCDALGVSPLDRLVRQTYRYADYVVVNSRHQRQSLQQRYGFLRDRIATIYNGYDLQALCPAAAEPQNTALQLLTIASVSRYKNGLCLIEALDVLRRRYNLAPTVTWIGQKIMAGDRLRYLREMEDSIRSYGLADQWCWLGQRTDIVEQLHAHDVLVHPSYGEGLPNVVCEALACARPAIVSNTLDHPHLVHDGVNGFLFDYADPADLADKIAQFEQLAPPQRSAMGRCGRRIAEAELSLERFVDQYETLFVRLLAR